MWQNWGKLQVKPETRCAQIVGLGCYFSECGEISLILGFFSLLICQLSAHNFDPYNALWNYIVELNMVVTTFRWTLRNESEFSIQNWGKLQVKLEFCHVGRDSNSRGNGVPREDLQGVLEILKNMVSPGCPVTLTVTLHSIYFKHR